MRDGRRFRVSVDYLVPWVDLPVPWTYHWDMSTHDPASELAAAETRADEKMRGIATELRRRAIAAGHHEAIATCNRFLAGDDSVGDSIQQGMRVWGL